MIVIPLLTTGALLFQFVAPAQSGAPSAPAITLDFLAADADDRIVADPMIGPNG
jgi:hypothetical protein